MVYITREQLKGSLTANAASDTAIVHIEETKTALSDAFALSVCNATVIDISDLRLTCSAHRTLKDLNKQFALTSQIPAAINKIMKTAGFHEHKECFIDGDTRPLEEVIHA